MGNQQRDHADHLGAGHVDTPFLYQAPGHPRCESGGDHNSSLDDLGDAVVGGCDGDRDEVAKSQDVHGGQDGCIRVALVDSHVY